MYLIDGHNLIPKIPGWSLSNIDDEQQLIEALQVYCQTHKREVEVFFDRAPAGFSGSRRYGRLTAHFVRTGRTADEAIRLRLGQLGKAARNAVVISSDRQVQQEAHSRGAQVITSDEFARELLTSRGEKTDTKNAKNRTIKAAEMTEEDMEEWLRLFGEDGEDSKPKK